MNNALSYIIGNESIIDEVEELWEKLNKYHQEKSQISKSLQGIYFPNEKRKTYFPAKKRKFIHYNS